MKAFKKKEDPRIKIVTENKYFSKIYKEDGIVDIDSVCKLVCYCPKCFTKAKEGENYRGVTYKCKKCGFEWEYWM